MDLNKLFRLDNKIAIVTGASRGIGEAIAKGLASAGAKVVLSSRKLEGLQKVADEINKNGGEAVAVPAHTGKIEDIKNLVAKTIEKFGKIDILINNAATNPVFGPIIDTDVPVWDKIFEVNVKGYFFLAKECANHMKDKGGVIVNMASVAGYKPMPLLGVYSVSKAAVIMLTRILALEWAPFNIRVNALAPGVIKTRFSEALHTSDEIVQEVLRNISIKRLGIPEDIVGACLFLCSDSASYITGQTIVIDGGGVMI